MEFRSTIPEIFIIPPSQENSKEDDSCLDDDNNGELTPPSPQQERVASASARAISDKTNHQLDPNIELNEKNFPLLSTNMRLIPPNTSWNNRALEKSTEIPQIENLDIEKNKIQQQEGFLQNVSNDQRAKIDLLLHEGEEAMQLLNRVCNRVDNRISRIIKHEETVIDEKEVPLSRIPDNPQAKVIGSKNQKVKTTPVNGNKLGEVGKQTSQLDFRRLNGAVLDLPNKDECGIAENFAHKNCGSADIGRKHMMKRLNHLMVMFKIIEDNVDGLNDTNFIEEMITNQFKAQNRFVASSLIKDMEKGREWDSDKYNCAHVGILNKVVVNKSGENRTIDCKFSILDHNSSSLHTDMFKFFNICDFAPKTINEIDSIAELCLRGRVYQHLNNIKSGKTPKEAAEDFLDDYEVVLKAINDYLTHNDIEMFREQIKVFRRKLDSSFKKILQSICSENNINYIKGMLDSIIVFRGLLKSENSIINQSLREFVYKF